MVPYSLVISAEREVDASNAKVLIVYPDDSTGQEVAEIIRAADALDDRNETSG